MQPAGELPKAATVTSGLVRQQLIILPNSVILGKP